jgi:hypothetical protein
MKVIAILLSGVLHDTHASRHTVALSAAGSDRGGCAPRAALGAGGYALLETALAAAERPNHLTIHYEGARNTAISFRRSEPHLFGFLRNLIH